MRRITTGFHYSNGRHLMSAIFITIMAKLLNNTKTYQKRRKTNKQANYRHKNWRRQQVYWLVTTEARYLKIRVCVCVCERRRNCVNSRISTARFKWMKCKVQRPHNTLDRPFVSFATSRRPCDSPICHALRELR